jgi:organic hydroperoxide reductase OsmC/OhrA
VPEHQYEVTVTWTGYRDDPVAPRDTHLRDHEIRIAGKPTILGSSDAAFSGDRLRHNPEELLVAALAQCHMLWYLDLCRRNRLHVLEYDDRATGRMAEDPRTGAGKFTEVTVRPDVVVEGDEAAHARAVSLHDEAAARCFIANSVNFPVRHQPRVRLAAPH